MYKKTKPALCFSIWLVNRWILLKISLVNIKKEYPLTNQKI